MGGKKREVKLTLEQEQFIYEHVLGSFDNAEMKRYRLDLADMQEILDSNGHEVPDESDYEAFRKKLKYGIQKFSENRSRVEQYFQYKAAKENQLNMFTEETDITENQGGDLARVNETASTEHDEQGSTDIQQATQPEINTKAQNIEGELITHSLTVNAPDSAPMDKQTTEAQPSKRGRKPKEGNYTHRIMIYVSPELESQINACCSALGTSITDFCVRILEKNIGKYEAEINEYIAKQKKMKSLFDD